MNIAELNRKSRILAADLADRCGCRNAHVHFGLARALIEASLIKGR